MRKHDKGKLKVSREVIRQLTNLTVVKGGMQETTSGTCPPATPYPSCTGCESINVECAPNPTLTCDGCTLWTF